ncbi:MAG TPA: hypothetical protein VFF82_01130 [Rhodocyclaceae bacterium]|nr:hypothetical protein [Rhodocyclaceae bacterium]
MRIFAIVLVLWFSSAGAHEVHHVVASTGAVMVSLNYADGSPFAYEKYELYSEGKDVPVQVGNTDAAGRVVFVPDMTKQWRLKAYSADGHGVDTRFDAPTVQSATPAADASEPGRLWRLVTGLALLFGLFGLYQLFRRR